MVDREPGHTPEARGPQESARGPVGHARRFTEALSEDRARRAALDDVAERRHGAVIPVSGDERFIARARRQD